MTTRHEVCAVGDVAEEGSRVIKEVSGREIAVFNHDGEYHAVLNFCPHQAGPLCEGQINGRTLPKDDGWSWGYDSEQKYVTCPWHAWKFDIETGDHVDSDKYQVPVYDTAVEDGTVYVEF
ncbi:Rieske 2Fe-2S domain-containing protein [Halobellus sp. GM3]|uniref:Rieske 2Fe-2S domain-containing protein n=1 Tax=Halobellus sp. GM3 TaxID=3458410 RepID=UPI00403DEEA6